MDQDRTGEVTALTQVLMQRGQLSPPQLGERLIHPATIQALMKSLFDQICGLDACKPEDREPMRRATAMLRVVVEYAVQAQRLSAATLADEDRALKLELQCMSWLYSMAGFEDAVALDLQSARRLDEANAQLERATAELATAKADLKRLRLAQKLAGRTP